MPRLRVTLKSGASSDCAADGSHQHEHVRCDAFHLGAKPRAARDDVRAPRPLVEAALAAGLPAEVLDRVREIDRRHDRCRPPEARVEHAPAGPTNTWPETSSRAPGCSPTSMSAACAAPLRRPSASPSRQSSHPRQPSAASRKTAMPRPFGTNGSAPCSPPAGARFISDAFPQSTRGKLVSASFPPASHRNDLLRGKPQSAGRQRSRHIA